MTSSLGDGPKPMSKQTELQTGHESAQIDGQTDDRRTDSDSYIPH